MNSVKSVLYISLPDSAEIIQHQSITESPLFRILLLLGIIIIGSLLYLAYHKWIVPPRVKESKEYKEKTYKDIDGC